MVVAYKRKEWGNDTYNPDDEDKYDDNETFNPKPKNGKLEFWLQRREKPNEKKDDHDDDKDNKCKEAKIYMTLTNLHNPNKPKLAALSLETLNEVNEVHMAEVRDTPDELNAADPRYVALSSTAADEGAPDSAVKVALSAVMFVMMMSLAYLF
jgi:hypothetical protein